jgi:FKBP-type peptidyl-prolyl cis-trans isomerase FkpA
MSGRIGKEVRMTATPSDGNAPGIPQLDGTIHETPSGLRYIEEAEGDGPEAQPGQHVSVHYTGWLTDGSSFDSSRSSGRPFDFDLGAGQVIQGWDLGVAGMRIGGKRKLIIPSDLGYGRSGYPPVIPQDATLIFDVELLAVR